MPTRPFADSPLRAAYRAACIWWIGRMPAMLMAVMLVAIAGCATSNGSRRGGSGWPNDPSRRTTFTVVEAQSALMSLSDSVMFSVGDACERVIRRTDRPEATLMTAKIRFGVGLSALSAATAPNVYIGFVDLITLVTLNRVSFEEKWPSELFAEEDRSLLHETFAQAEADLWERADLIWTPEQQEELRGMIKLWREANPERRDLFSVRLLEFATERQVAQGNPVTGARMSLFRVLLIDPAANLSPATRQLAESRLLAERLTFFGKRLPVVLGWQFELASARMLESSAVQGLLRDTSRVTAAVGDFTKSADRMATSYERTLDELPKERAAAIEQLDQVVADRVEAAIEQLDQALAERVETMIEQTSAALTPEREATVEQVRDGFATSLESSIDRLSERFEAQSKETLEQTASIIADERKQLSESLESHLAEVDAKSQRLVDRIAWRLFMVIVAGALAVACIAFVYRRIEARFSSSSR